MMEFSPQGIPILKMQEKLDALSYCMKNGSYEDAVGHMCDLLEHCRHRIITHDGMMFVGLKAMVEKYGKNPCPIKENDDG